MPLREISINVPRDGSPQQQSLRKKATVEALATSLRRAAAARSSTPPGAH